MTNASNPNKDKLIIFDTTLRDGEQSPGVTLTVNEKIEIAKQLSSLGVDILEAGFPVASQGDFDAVERIATEVGPLMVGREAIGKPMVRTRTNIRSGCSGCEEKREESLSCASHHFPAYYSFVSLRCNHSTSPLHVHTATWSKLCPSDCLISDQPSTFFFLL